MDLYNFTHEEELYVKTELYNWDHGNDWLYKTLESKYCDKATALMIYWRSDPKYYYSNYDSEVDVPEGWELNGYKLMKEAEKLLLKNSLLETISYTPDKERIPVDASVLKKIPAQLLQPTKGVDSNLIIKNHIEAQYLIDACKNGSLEEVKKRLDKNPSILNLCIGDKNPLIQAVSHYNNKNVIDLVTFLLEKGADCNAQPKGHPHVPIIFRCFFCKNAELIELLVKNSADINAVNYESDTILHKQLKRSHEIWKRDFGPKYLKALLTLGADPNKKNAEGKTSLDIAKENDNEPALIVIEKYLKNLIF